MFTGTKQDPFQSAEGALWKRGLEVSLWIKRRYTNTDRYVTILLHCRKADRDALQEIRSRHAAVWIHPDQSNRALDNLLDTYRSSSRPRANSKRDGPVERASEGKEAVWPVQEEAQEQEYRLDLVLDV